MVQKAVSGDIHQFPNIVIILVKSFDLSSHLAVFFYPLLHLHVCVLSCFLQVGSLVALVCERAEARRFYLCVWPSKPAISPPPTLEPPHQSPPPHLSAAGSPLSLSQPPCSFLPSSVFQSVASLLCAGEGLANPTCVALSSCLRLICSISVVIVLLRANYASTYSVSWACDMRSVNSILGWESRRSCIPLASQVKCILLICLSSLVLNG